MPGGKFHHAVTYTHTHHWQSREWSLASSPLRVMQYNRLWHFQSWTFRAIIIFANPWFITFDGSILERFASMRFSDGLTSGVTEMYSPSPTNPSSWSIGPNQWRVSTQHCNCVRCFFFFFFFSFFCVLFLLECPISSDVHAVNQWEQKQNDDASLSIRCRCSNAGDGKSCRRECYTERKDKVFFFFYVSPYQHAIITKTKRRKRRWRDRREEISF